MITRAARVVLRSQTARGLRFFSAVPERGEQANDALKVAYLSFAQEESGIDVAPAPGFSGNREAIQQMTKGVDKKDKPAELAKRMRAFMIQAIDLAAQWQDNLQQETGEPIITVAATPEGTFFLPADEEFMLTDDIFQQELIKPLQAYISGLPDNLLLNFGSFGVLVDGSEDRFEPADYQPAKSLTGEGLDANAAPNFDTDLRRRSMHAAIHGISGKNGAVDYYSKRNVWVGDHYKNWFPQVYDSTRPNIVIHNIAEHSLVRAMYICLDGQQPTNVHEFKKIAPSLAASEQKTKIFVGSEMVSFRGGEPDPEHVPTKTVFISEGALPERSGVYELVDGEFVKTASHTTQGGESINLGNEEWPINAKMYPHQLTTLEQQLHQAMEDEQEQKDSNFMKIVKRFCQ